ncbi:hypothetical protein RirG_132390 [Rhizophagus irregularis DAOM 197198w]|uniref:Uncharacterized protein n=1 Tax=Rhizophagus irregularis (strain DAOM 197198w) TaxID=1432141 RepID=A0A015J7J1_RHIIW|nr:hypothetical protein RirG_132390 [Rhizophagus irregularis DAOM 197198w]
MSHASPLVVRILHSLLVFALLVIFGYQLYSVYKTVNVPTEAFSINSEKALVPPALTFCLTRETSYLFSIEIYNQTVDRGTYLKQYPIDSYELSSIKGLVARCWILSPPVGVDRALIKNPPPVPNVPDMVFTTTRADDGLGVSPLLINIFDPLQRDTLFDFNRFVSVNPDANRAIQFTRTKHIDLKGKVVNDVKYNIIEEFRDSSQTVPGFSFTNNFPLGAASFDVPVTTEVITITIPVAIYSTLTFLGVLITSVYLPLVGQGKYRPWGYINRLTGYYPVEHISRSGNSPQIIEAGLLKKGDDSPTIPTIEEKLGIYLEKIGKAKYSN